MSYGLTDVKLLTPVKPLNTVTLLQGVRGLQEVTPLTFTGDLNSNNYIYNRVIDQTPEKANSLLDVAFGTDQRRALLEKYDLGNLNSIPLVNIIAGAGTLTWDKYVDPVARTISGDITLTQAGKEIVLNSLTELSEDLDIFSNLVKSQFYSAGGKPGLESLSDALGLNGNRVVYNFNTGNTLKDIAFEVLSDPLTLIELGSKAVAAAGSKSAAKTLSNTAGDQITKILGKELSESSVKNLSKAAVKAATSDEAGVTFLRYLSKKTVQEVGEDNIRLIAPLLIKEASQTEGYRLAAAALKIHAPVQAFDDELTKLIRYATPLGYPAEWAAALLKNNVGAIYNSIVKNLTDKFDLDLYFIGYSGAYQGAIKHAMYMNEQINKSKFKMLYDVAASYGYKKEAITALQNLYLDFLKDLELKNIPLDKFPGNQFGKYLESLGTTTEPYVNLLHIFGYKSDDLTAQETLNNTIALIGTGPHAVKAAEFNRQQISHLASIESLQKYIQEHNNDLENLYKYIDEDVLKINDKHYGLSNLDEFLTTIGMDKSIDKTYKIQLSRLLETAGVNLNNAHNIQKIIKSNITNKNKALEQLLADTITDFNNVTYKNYDKRIKMLEKKTLSKESKAIDNMWQKEIVPYNYDKYSVYLEQNMKNVEDAIKEIQNEQLYDLGDTAYKNISVFTDTKNVPNIVQQILDPDADAETILKSIKKLKKEMKDSYGLNINGTHIYINPKMIDEGWAEEVWKKGRTSRYLRRYNFESKQEYLQYVIDHEYMHTRIKYKDALKDPDLSKILDKKVKNFDTKMNQDKLNYILKDLKGETRIDKLYNLAYEELIDDLAIHQFIMQKRPIAYIRDTVRLQQLPDITEFNSRLDKSLKTHASIINKDRRLLTSIRDIKDFLKQTEHIMQHLDTDKSTYNTIIQWWNSLTNVQISAAYLQERLVGQIEDVQTRALLKRIQNYIYTIKLTDMKDSIFKYVDNLEGVVTPQLKHQKAFDIMVQHTHLSNNKDVRELLNTLVIPDSPQRKMYEGLINVLEEARRPNEALTIRKLLAQIDTVNNMTILNTTEIPLSFKITKHYEENLRSILFDAIDNHSDYTIADIISGKTFNGKTRLQTIQDQIRYRVTTTETLNQQLQKIMIENGLTDMSVVHEEIIQQLNNMLDSYIKRQQIIARYLDNVSLSTIYDDKTISGLVLFLSKDTNKYIFDLAEELGSNFKIEYADAIDTLMNDFELFKTEGVDKGLMTTNKLIDKYYIPIRYEEINKVLTEHNEAFNLYSASLESSMFSTKWVIDNTYTYKDKITGELKTHVGFINKYKLPLESFSGTTTEYVMLADHLKSFENLTHESYKYEDKYQNMIKQALIDTYTRPNALFAPKDPYTYFNSIDAQELLTWEVFTKSGTSIDNRTFFARNIVNARHMVDSISYDFNTQMSDQIAQIEDIMRNAPFTDSDEIAAAAAIGHNADVINYTHQRINRDLVSTYHSIEDLGQNKDKLAYYFKQDTEKVDDIFNRIVHIEDDPKLYDDIPFEDIDTTIYLGGGEYGWEEPVRKSLFNATTERTSTLALSIASLDAEQLATYVYKNTDGILVFHNNNIIKHLTNDNTVVWSPIEHVFEFSEKELKDAGLKIKKVTTVNGDWYYIRLTDNRVHNATYKLMDLPDTHDYLQFKVTTLIDDYRRYLNLYNYDDIPSNLLLVQTLNEDTWNNFINANEDFFGNIKERKLYQKLSKEGINTFFDKSFERINTSVIGGFDTYNIWNSIYSDNFIPHSLYLTRNTQTGLISMIHRSNKINKYLTLFFNKDWSLTESFVLRNMFANATDKELIDFFKTGDYKVAILRTDKQGLPKVYEYKIINRKAFKEACDLGGIMVPKETFYAMKSVVNKRVLSNDFLSVFRRVVPATYKNMYLYTAGFPFRNEVDTIYKNLNEMGGLDQFANEIRYRHIASKAIQLHNEVQNKAIKLAGGETFTKENILKVLEAYSKEEIETYFLMDIFMGSAAASGTLSESLKEFLEEYNKKHTPDLRAAWEKFYEDKVLFGKQSINPLHHLSELNDHIEMSARGGLFLWALDNGDTVDEALDRVVKTHFDYTMRDDILTFFERIFWFATFPINNLNYYINGGLNKSPMLLRLLMDTQTASWNNGEYTYEELKKTNFLAYHAMTGNLRIGNWIIKTSPSVFDFINLVMNPIEQMKERLNPFLAITTGVTKDLKELNPAQSQFRFWSKQFQGNPVPSILSQVSERDWSRTLGKWRNNYQPRTWTTYPKRVGSTAYKTYLRKYYARRYGTRVRRLVHPSLYRDPYKYYKLYKRGVTYYDL